VLDINGLQTLIGQYGFPIFTAIWFMVKTSQDSKNMTEALVRLTEAIVVLQTKYDKEAAK